jgi:MFS family permease
MSEPRPGASEAGRGYRGFVLAVLMLVYLFNVVDRQILSILNERIKADLALSDAQMGFLFGTAFAVFHAVFGLPLARLADVWVRRSLIAAGLAFWSVMTALSGLASGFGQLAALRIGLGIGEATSTPAGYSLIADYFAPRRRATAISIFASGALLGGGTGILVGGLAVGWWDGAWEAGRAPLGLTGWRVAFLLVGLPGLLLALVVRLLREPLRGAADGLAPPAAEPHPFRAFLLELRAVVPPFPPFHLARLGAGRSGVARNLAGAALVAAAAAALVAATGDRAQWISLGIGTYAALSWMQALRLRDPVAAALTFGTRSLRLGCVGFACVAMLSQAFGYWTAPLLIRQHGASYAQLGATLGALQIATGWAGVTCGGVLADAWRRRSPRGRLALGIASALGIVPFGLALAWAGDLRSAYAASAGLYFFSALWIGVGPTVIQELVLPRMRAIAASFYGIVFTFLGYAIGPYLVGKLSDATGDLREALTAVLLAAPAAIALLALAMRHVARDEATLRERAHAAGEPR